MNNLVEIPNIRYHPQPAQNIPNIRNKQDFFDFTNLLRNE